MRKVLDPPTGTINCSALNEKGEMSSVTTTSGLAWKLAGRWCADFSDYWRKLLLRSGGWRAAGATGSGEENIKKLWVPIPLWQHALRHVAGRSRHAYAEAYRTQLQQ